MANELKVKKVNLIKEKEKPVLGAEGYRAIPSRTDGVLVEFGQKMT